MSETPAWLLLVHQLPAKPGYVRVKAWRRLQALGAVSLKGSVYALPANDQTLEDLQWLAKEIVADGGEAMVCAARLIAGLTDDDARALFRAQRDEDYRALADELRALAEPLPPGGLAAWEGAHELKGQLRRLRKRLDQIVGIDFFGAPGRAAAAALIGELEARLEPEAAAGPSAGAPVLAGRTWVTREGVHVDRIACAWLIRRFIDTAARFKFVPAKGYRPEPGDLRFDMFEAEFTHEGDKCSFEVLVERMAPADPALVAIGEIIHDLDLKDGKYGREETAGIGHLLQGIAAPGRGDEERIARGGAMLDDLYDFFGGRPAGA